MKFQPPELRGDQRYLFLGKTRSGKSYLARYLLKLARSKKWRVVIIDPKKDWMGRGPGRRKFAEGKSLGTIDSPVYTEIFRPELAVQIFQPVEWNDTCAAFFRAITEVGNTIVYFDEISQLVTASRVPLEFNVLWTQGAALNIGAWCATQRPRNIPLIVKDQAEVWFIFRIINIEDRKIVVGYVPTEGMPEIVANPLPYRWFYFWDDSMAVPVLVKPLNLKQEVAA